MILMHPLHAELLKEIKKHRNRGTTLSKSDSYILSGHPYYDIAVPIRRSIAKAWLKSHKDISSHEFIRTLDSLYAGKSHEEKTIASNLLGYSPVHRARVTTTDVDRWLNHLVGWAEVDSLCQNIFTADELLAHWGAWEKFIVKLSKDKNINKRRASLVLLTGPVRSTDIRILALAFAMCEALKHEKPILITKAISWLLRNMVATHKNEVRNYLARERESLPKIAVRETTRKILTGRK